MDFDDSPRISSLGGGLRSLSALVLNSTCLALNLKLKDRL